MGRGKEIRDCSKCIWGDGTYKHIKCDDYYPIDEEEHWQSMIEEYNKDLHERYRYYNGIIEDDIECIIGATKKFAKR